MLERRELGPFDVSTLAASHAEALGDWLQTNGYTLPEGLTSVIQPYVTKGWYYIAVRLRPGQGETLTGKLDPLWVTFPSDQIVYPMRVMRLAELPHSASFLPLFLYVLADHRVEPPLAMVTVDNRYSPRDGNTAEVTASMVKFAGWVDPATLAADSPLPELVPERRFLTKFQLNIHDPAKIADDFMFSFAAEDTLHREVETRYEPAVRTGSELWLVITCLGIIIVGLLAGGYGLKRL